MLKKIINAVRWPQKINQTAIIEQIHRDFDTSSERLLKEAKELLSAPADTDKGDRLAAIGFVKAEKVVEAQKARKERQEKRLLAEKIEHYTFYYPNNKFITEREVKTICKKYGLVFAAVEYYKADVPEKNLREIEQFRLRDEDQRKYKCGWYRLFGGGLFFQQITPVNAADLNGCYYGYLKNPCQLIKVYDKSKREVLEKDPLRICAPEKDFDMTNLIRVGHKLEIEDPIVLQPVDGGYLVVSKWGLEASDEIVVNQKMN